VPRDEGWDRGSSVYRNRRKNTRYSIIFDPDYYYYDFFFFCRNRISMLITRFHSIVLSRARERRRYNHLHGQRTECKCEYACVRVCGSEREGGTARARETKQHAATTFQKRSLVEIYNLGLDSWLQRVPTRRSRRHNISRRPAGR